MSTRTKWISDAVWRCLPSGLREELLAELAKKEIVGRYASNVESDLRARGEHRLADEFLEELNYLPYPLRIR